MGSFVKLGNDSSKYIGGYQVLDLIVNLSGIRI